MCNHSIIIYSFSYHASADTMTLVVEGEQHIFTSPNQPHLPNVSPPSFDLPESSSAFFKPLWNLEKFPYLAFIPKNPTTSNSSLTARLATEPNKMRLCFSSGRWSLQPDTIAAWKSLENNLVTATTGLFAFATKRYPSHDTVFYPHRSKVPSHYSYDKAFVKKEELLATLESARRAFFIEMGRCSYALALTLDPNDPSATPLWPEFLHKEQRLEYAWLDMLQASPIAQFSASNPRVGVVIHITKCRWLEAIPVMVSLGIPIWLYWGSYPMLYTPQHSCIESYAPAPHPTSDLNPKMNVPLPSGFPSIDLGSGQLPGETWRAFFARRKQDDEKRRARESNSERQQRENRERASNPAMGPGRKGAKVWHWEMVDGFRVRTLVTRGRVEDEWEIYSRVQKIFNGFRNEWDICTEFGEDDTVTDIDIDTDDEPILPIGPSKSRKADSSQSSHLPPSQPLPSDAFSKQQDPNIGSSNTIHPTPSESRNLAPNQPQSIHLPTCQPPSCDPPPHHVSLETVSHRPRHHTPFESGSEAVPPGQVQAIPHDSDGDDDELCDDDDDELRNRLSESGRDVLYAYSYRPLPASQCLFDDLAHLLYFRFGFNFGAGRYVVPAEFKPVFGQWYEVISSVGGQDLDSQERQRPVISYFLSLLFSSKANAASVIPPEFWDLHPNNPEPLEFKQPRFLDIELKSFSNDPAVCILRARNLHPSRNASWLVAVSPMTALEILRRDVGPHSADIAHFLIGNGISFNTLSPLSKIPPSISSPPGPLPSLGMRPPGYVFTLADFIAYEAVRDSVLLRLPQARAALCQGGIIARLSRDVLDNSVVMAGPSESAQSGDQRKFISNGEIYCDDCLTSEVMDLIVGAYEVQTWDKQSRRLGLLDFSLYHFCTSPNMFRPDCMLLLVSSNRCLDWIWP
jgi:hypothetical protein